MGGGIAMCFANKGIPVVLVDVKDEFLQRGLGVIRKNYENTMKKGKLKPVDFQRRVNLIKGSLDYKDLHDVDMVEEKNHTDNF